MAGIVLEHLEGTDWRAAWVERSRRRRKPDACAYWDDRAREFRRHSGRSEYADAFLAMLDLAPGQSVLDMGCGTGTLALPLAEAGHPVTAADFSEGMRTALAERARSAGIGGLNVLPLSWTDDWQGAGLAPKSADVAVASRSIMVEDLWDALMKLDAVARHKVAVTVATEYSPRGYKALGSAAEGLACYLPDYLYVMGILWQMGANPELRYIDTTRPGTADPELGSESIPIRWAFISWKPVSA
ncbi:MAG: methyltransferase domain-containing protein [Coriobacteriales bacterium]|nr:methyltransferase domain-containing protein [Coriobacteriales bacterium]